MRKITSTKYTPQIIGSDIRSEDCFNEPNAMPCIFDALSHFDQPRNINDSLCRRVVSYRRTMPTDIRFHFIFYEWRNLQDSIKPTETYHPIEWKNRNTNKKTQGEHSKQTAASISMFTVCLFTVHLVLIRILSLLDALFSFWWCCCCYCYCAINFYPQKRTKIYILLVCTLNAIRTLDFHCFWHSRFRLFLYRNRDSHSLPFLLSCWMGRLSDAMCVDLIFSLCFLLTQISVKCEWRCSN